MKHASKKRNRQRAGWCESWAGGRVWQSEDGEKTYHIERMVKGERYAVSTRKHTEDEALAELALFARDPKAYTTPPPPPPAEPAGVRLDESLATEFIDWSKEEGLSADWLRKKRAYLAFWTRALWGKDLRNLDLDVILAAVPKGRTPARAHKIAVLKSLYEYLRNPEQRRAYRPGSPLIKASEDPMLAVHVPQTQPAQSIGEKQPIPIEHIMVVLERLGSQVWRDCVTVLAATGWHATELDYFAREGRVEDLPSVMKRDGAAGSLVTFHRKGKKKHFKPTPVNASAVEAAKRIREHGGFDIHKLDKAIRSACEAAGIPPFGYGRFRHTVSAFAKAQGVAQEDRAEFLQHDPKTNVRFYGQSVPKKIPTPWDEIETRTATTPA